MKISTKGRYALRVMIDIAEQKSDGFIPLKDIAARQEISQKYLEAIMKDLTKAGILDGHQGKGGGYRLNREADGITVFEILSATEGDLAPISCLESGAKPCSRAAECRTLPMWEKFYSLIKDFFDGVTLADLVGTDRSGDNYVI